MTVPGLACSLILLVGGLLSPLVAEAQRADKIARVGWLGFNLSAGDPRVRVAVLQGLRDLGYVEGRNLQIEYRDAGGRPSGARPSRESWSRSRSMSS